MADTAARWPEVERIYHAALELSGDARDAFVVRACGEDPALLADVRSLLIYESAAGGFLTRPALEHVARATPEHKAGSLTGRQIHGYELRSLLGAGGMGEVYLARDLRLGRDVALKILRRSVASDPGYLRRFEDEARSASVLNHPNIVTIYGVGEDGDIGYIAMERVNGRTLREIIASANLAVPAVLDLAVQLADALAVAHAAGIVHRDLKPDNVMVTPDGLLKVLDFGIAKREGVPDAETQITGPSASQTMETEAGTILGTVGYMSPEQAVGRRAGPASDQFSFGAIVYELLTGRRAFERTTKAGTLDAIKSEQPEAIQAINANVMPALRKVVERCLAKEPAQRFPKASDLALELRDIRERLAGRGLTRRQVLWLGSAAALAAAAAGGLAWRFWPREPRVRSVALLPFDNTGDDRSLDPFSEGITADLIRRIAVLPSIDVMAQSLVSNFKRMKLDARSFGRKIGAESVLTGSIARQGSNLTIAVALIEVASGKQLWSNSYARPAADLQGIQDAIASEIVDNGIRLQLSKEERALLSRRLTSVPAAYELFLQATYLREKGGQAELLQARLLLLRAVQLDPTFAQAYAVLAGTYSIAAIEGYELPREVWPDQYRYVREAMEHDQELPDAYAETANRAFYCDWTWEESERQWTLAMRSRGAEIESHLKMSRALMQRALGHTALALQVCREVRARDQLSPALMVDEANYLLADGRLDEAYRTYEQALRADPDLGFAKTGLIEVRLAQRNFDDAIDLRRQMLNGVDEDLTRILASARGEKGFQRIEAFMTQVDLDTLDLSAAAGQYVAPYQRAVLHARMGQRPEALRYLEAACDERDAGLVFLKAQRVWRPFDNDPRFQSVVRKVGLP